MPPKAKAPREDGRIIQYSTIKARLYPNEAQLDYLFPPEFGSNETVTSPD